MRTRHSVPSAIACGLLLLFPAHAQSPGRPDPLNPEAAVPPPKHRSALAGYRSIGDVAVGDWRAANETVNRIGGWRTYAREAAAPEPPAPPASAAGPAVAPAPAGAAGAHHHHGGSSR